jgi:hypothetical protein
MASNHHTSPNDGGFSLLVREARQQMQNARNIYWHEKTSGDGSVSWEVRELLARRAVQYYDILWEYKTDRQSVEQAWDESDIEMIQQLAHDARTVDVAAPGDTSNTQQVQKPALAALDPSKLVELTKQLDQIANDLGFSAGVKSEREFGQIGGDDMYEEEADE